uniref:Uncharacterized protein n=1 Tax=Trichobilharzia regenti TaxID=157069 RepID=A0AA85IY04_TRIRE|nr:unnamed protein product [Trichobilharzia regenti]
MQIIDISSSNVVRMEYTMNCYLRQQWIDPRLAWHANPVLNSSVSNLLLNQQKKQLWLPDLFFRNGKSGFLHHISQPNFLLRVNSNGQVLYSQKITMVLACQMYLKNFPMDRQECTVDIGSYGYTIDQLKFIWHHEKPVTISDELQLLEFERPQKTYTTDCTKNGTTKTGTYSCLLMVIPLRRLLSSYIVTTYIPEVLIVMVSWLGFWIDIKAVPARVTLGLLTLLGLLTESSSVSSQLPKVTYLKAIDVWLTVCLLFVVAALAEFAYAYMMAPKIEGHEWEPEVTDLVQALLTSYTGEVRCCCCYTKNTYHKPVLKVNSQRSRSHQPQTSTDSVVKRSNLKVNRGTESDPEVSVKSKRSTRTSRSKHIKSSKVRCTVCDSYKPVCCTCPACARLKCPEAPTRRKPTQVKISTRSGKHEPNKSVKYEKQKQQQPHQQHQHQEIDLSTPANTLKKRKPVKRGHSHQSVKTTDSCRVLIEPLYKEVLSLDKQPKKSALKVKSQLPSLKCEYTPGKELKTTFLDSSNNNNNGNKTKQESFTSVNHNHNHQDIQSKERLWHLRRSLNECFCLNNTSHHQHDHTTTTNTSSTQQLKIDITRRLNSMKSAPPYESSIDAYSRLIFPIAFCLFMCIYWFIYLLLTND